MTRQQTVVKNILQMFEGRYYDLVMLIELLVEAEMLSEDLEDSDIHEGLATYFLQYYSYS